MGPGITGFGITWEGITDEGIAWDGRPWTGAICGATTSDSRYSTGGVPSGAGDINERLRSNCGTGYRPLYWLGIRLCATYCFWIA